MPRNPNKLSFIRYRARPSAYRSSQKTNWYGREIILSSSRGYVKLDAKEARELAAELIASAEEVESGKPVVRHWEDDE